MRELASVLGGIGLLIFAYLAFTKASGVSQVSEGLAKSAVDVISVLQGNSATITGSN
jgi:hypothetical protein